MDPQETSCTSVKFPDADALDNFNLKLSQSLALADVLNFAAGNGIAAGKHSPADYTAMLYGLLSEVKEIWGCAHGDS